MKTPPRYVPSYVRADPDRTTWATSTRDLLEQLRTVRWHKGSLTAAALRIAAITRPRSERKTIEVPLSLLTPVHPITPGDAQLGARLTVLRGVAKKIEANGVFTAHQQQAYLASKNPIRVVRDDEGRCFVMDGNLRYAALRASFPSSQRVEVELISDDPTAWKLAHHLVSVRSAELKAAGADQWQAR